MVCVWVKECVSGVCGGDMFGVDGGDKLWGIVRRVRDGGVWIFVCVVDMVCVCCCVVEKI